jgi:hypothetical protein
LRSFAGGNGKDRAKSSVALAATLGFPASLLSLPVVTARAPGVATCCGCSTKVPFAAPAFVKMRWPAAFDASTSARPFHGLWSNRRGYRR